MAGGEIWALVEVTCSPVGANSHPAPSKIRVVDFYVDKSAAQRGKSSRAKTMDAPPSYPGQDIYYLVWNLKEKNGLNIDLAANPGERPSNCGTWLDQHDEYEREVSDLSHFSLVVSDAETKKRHERRQLESRVSGRGSSAQPGQSTHGDRRHGRTRPRPGLRRTRHAPMSNHVENNNIRPVSVNGAAGSTFGSSYSPLNAHR